MPDIFRVILSFNNLKLQLNNIFIKNEADYYTKVLFNNGLLLLIDKIVVI